MEDKKRLIDVIPYAEQLESIIIRERERMRHIPIMQDVIDLLDIARKIALDQPVVNAVEVVRCKDCKHRADELDCGNYLCNRKMIGMVRPSDFCSFAERQTDG